MNAETISASTDHAFPPIANSATTYGKLSGVKVALVHDWLTGMRGGEKVLEVLCEMFPEAPLWTLVHVPGSVSEAIEMREIHTSFLQHLPFAKKKYRHYLPLFPLAAEMNKVTPKDADVVISTSHAVAKAMIRRGADRRPLHICYVHTPMRYIWDRFDDYFGPERVGRFLSSLIFRPIARLLQVYDRKTVDRVDVYCTNSDFVARRIRDIYGRKAAVIHPGSIRVGNWIERNPEDWYLMVTALVPYKRVDQAITACAQLGRPLKIVGSGPEASSLKRLADKLGCAVEFLGFVTDDELLGYYARAKALIFPGVEDFGLVPVEAIAAGCPVIALARGGVVDSMTAETAELYEEESSAGLRHALMRFESRKFSEAMLRRRGAEFSRDTFRRRFEELVEQVLAARPEAVPATVQN